jgi:hypothetical protein
MKSAERGLEPGHAERRLLERDVLLVPGMRCVVGADAVDGAVDDSLDERPAVVL